MQTVNTNLKAQMQGVYERAYHQALADKEPNEVKIGIVSDGHEKVFTERNFYWCGFNSLHFKCVGKNRELRKFARPDYPSGFRLKMDEIGSRGNGDYEIQQVAYAKVESFLNDEGYTVYLESRMD